MATTLPYAPAACTFDTLGLFTHGEFRTYQSPNPCLNLGTHGEFPRALFKEEGGVAIGVQGGTGGKRSRVLQAQVIDPCKDEDLIALTLLLAEEDDDDWW